MGFFDIFEKPQQVPEEEQNAAEKSPQEYKNEIEDILLRREQIKMDRTGADKGVEEQLNKREKEIKDEIGEEEYEKLVEEINNEEDRSENLQEAA